MTQLNQKKIKIVIDDAVPFAHAIFSHLGEVVTQPGRDICQADLVDATVLIVRSRTQVNAELLSETAVKFVGSTVVGLDHVDQTWLKDNGIHFYSAQGCNANSVAEFVITALFQLAEKNNFELNNKTLGIIGVGNVGKRLNNKAKILGIKTLLNDPPRQAVENLPDYVDLTTALTADIISPHTPLTSLGEHPTRDLINASHLKKLSTEPIIVNAARGGIINEHAWTHTPTAANIIDCWENEPYADTDLYAVADYATPHIAGHSLDAKTAGSDMVYQALCPFLRVKPQTRWHAERPSAPAPINVTALIPNMNTASNQSLMCAVLSAAHSPLADDLAVRGSNINDTHKKFEYYRRHYPEYQEWHRQTLRNCPKHLHSIFNQLGFKVI